MILKNCARIQVFLFSALLIFACLFSIKINAQLIPDQRSIDWEIAGLNPSENPSGTVKPLSSPNAQVYNFILDFGGDNSGKKDNATLLSDALESISTPAVIHFPSGIYLFKKTIYVPSGVIIRGTSPNTTLFLFDLSGDNTSLFVIRGRGRRNTTEYKVKVTNPYHKGSDVIEVEDGKYFNAGDNIELDQENDPKMYFWSTHNTEWARRSVGQMLKVSRVQGKKIYLDRTLTLDYETKFDLRVSKVEMTENVGFEAITVDRLDNGLGSNFLFEYAANCWISCVKSVKATRYHVEMRKSRNCLISGSYFLDAQFHCGGGAGYGVMLRQHATECLIYNNIFTGLRHSMIVKEGANRNVLSYNYSNEVTISDGTVKDKNCYNARIVDFPDISIHGHYSYMNLFEHNVVQAIHSADNWGSTGPGTTFFRNKVETNYGIKISMASENQNVMGNVVKGFISEDEEVIGTVKLKNREIFGIDTLSSLALPPSLYLTDKPEFYGNHVWPSIDPSLPISESTNPAKERSRKGVVFDRYCCGDMPAMNSYVMHRDDFIIFYEAGTMYVEHIMDKKYEFALFDIQGKLLRKISDFSTNKLIDLGFFLPQGLYVLKLLSKKESYQYKLMVK